MAAHIQTLETQDSMLAQWLGGGMPPRTCDGQLHELSQCAVVLDERHGENQSTRRRGSVNNVNRDNNRNGRGRGRDSGRGRGNGRGGRGRGRGAGRTSDQMTDDCVTPDKWAAMTPKERCDHVQSRQKKTQIDSSNQSHGDGASAVDAPPATMQVQTQTQSQQGQQQNDPGSMIRNMMSQSSQRAQSKDSDCVCESCRDTHSRSQGCCEQHPQ